MHLYDEQPTQDGAANAYANAQGLLKDSAAFLYGADYDNTYQAFKRSM